MGNTYTSGFSIGDTELDRVKIQLKNIKDTYKDEKSRKDEVFNQQNGDLDKTTKEVDEAK